MGKYPKDLCVCLFLAEEEGRAKLRDRGGGLVPAGCGRGHTVQPRLTFLPTRVHDYIVRAWNILLLLDL